MQMKPTLEDGILEIFSPIKTISCSSSFLFFAIFKNSVLKVSALTLTGTCDRQTQMISNANLEGSVIKKDDTFMILSENIL